MSSHIRPKLTAGDIPGLIYAFPFVIGTILTFIVTSTWSQWRDGYLRKNSLSRNAVASFGTLVNHLTPRQLQGLLPYTTGSSIKKYCHERGLALQSVLVVNNDGFPPATLHFIDCRLEQKEPILLYFHGGGFVVPLQSPAFALSLARTARTGLVLVEYTLAPECLYPGQLAQAVAALQLILSHREPSQVIIGGESAGGNVALAIMAHLQQPKPGITPLSLSSPRQQQQRIHPAKFKGVLAISPRTTNTGTSDSFRYNSGKDFMSKHTVGVTAANWKPEEDVWAAPVLARDGFWAGLKAERLLLLVGGYEVSRDDVCHVAKSMGAKEVEITGLEMKAVVEKGHDPALQLIVCPGEVHCQAIIDWGLRIQDGFMMRGTVGWLARF